jgi:hypothetical protein
MKTSAVVEVDRLRQELLAPPPLTDEALVARVIDVLGQVAGDLMKVIDEAETAEQAFERFAAIDIDWQLYRCATAYASARRALELRAAARRAH